MTVIEAPPAGRRVYFVGHSFHMFIVRPLIQLAKEAGIKGHWAEGWDMIGGSTPMQHWERNGDDNEPKRALREGRVDVLTLCSNVIIPEPAIDLFADLAVEHNPAVRIFVQRSWGDQSTGLIMRARHVTKGALPDGIPTNDDRDHVTAEQLAAMRDSGRPADDALRAQVRGINERHGDVACVVPVGEAVLRLREAVVAGQVPGIERQSQLFRDALGHATQPTMDLVTYAWLYALYGVSPIGSKALVDVADPLARERHLLLQRIAVQTLDDEPLSGRP